MDDPVATPFRGYVLTHVLDCLADPTKIRVVAEAQGNVAEILPYLNALIPTASYSSSAGILTFRRDHRLITLYPHVALIAKADDEADAEAVLGWLRVLINHAYARRVQIVPSCDRRRTVAFLDVYRLLPGGNCKACGLPTCLAFAVALLDGRAALAGCPSLDREHASHLAGLVPGS